MQAAQSTALGRVGILAANVTHPQPIAGRVIGTEDAPPLELWVAVSEGQFLQLDDVVALERELPSGETVHIMVGTTHSMS